MDLFYFTHTSNFGEILFTIDSKGVIKELWLGKQVSIKKGKLHETLLNRIPNNTKVLQAKEALISQLKAYEEGRLKNFTLTYFVEGTIFQNEVWKMLMDIPYGTTKTYGELAHEIARKRGKDKFSAQAVGQAIGKNPLSIIIPCHRVIGKKGSLVGYSGGIDIKEKLLEIEMKI